MKIKKISQVSGTLGSIVNTENESTIDTYSCNYINDLQMQVRLLDNMVRNLKPVVLYSSTGSNGDITLSDNITNYSYIEIIYRNQENKYSSVKCKAVNNTVANLHIITTNTAYANLWTPMREVILNGTTIKTSGALYGEAQIGSAMAYGHINYIYIVQVLGYK